MMIGYMEENIIMLYENFSKRGKLYKEGVSPEYDKRNKLIQFGNCEGIRKFGTE